MSRVGNWDRLVVYLAGLVPGAWTFWLALNDELGADPQAALEKTLGLWALRFLLLALAVSPIRQWLGVNLLRYRRAIGLLAFYYAAAHLLVYAFLDRGLYMHAIIADLLKRPFIMAGFLALIILAPLAVTSHDRMIRWMGPKRWRTLHKWIYLAGGAAALHFIMLVKAWPLEPLLYAGILVILLGARLMTRRRTAPI